MAWRREAACGDQRRRRACTALHPALPPPPPPVQALAVVAAGGVTSGASGWLFASAAERVMFRLRARLFGALLRQEVGFFDRARTGELTNRLSEDTRLLKSVATGSISQALRAAAVCALGLAMM